MLTGCDQLAECPDVDVLLQAAAFSCRTDGKSIALLRLGIDCEFIVSTRPALRG